MTALCIARAARLAAQAQAEFTTGHLEEEGSCTSRALMRAIQVQSTPNIAHWI